MPAAAQQLLQAHPDVDGVLVLIDTFASGAVRAFQNKTSPYLNKYGWLLAMTVSARANRCRR